MKKRTIKAKVIVDGLEALAWAIGARHVPKWDNVPDPDDYLPIAEDPLLESTTSPEEAEAIDQAFSPQFYKYGKDEIKEGRLVQAHKIGIVTREAGELDWDVEIYQEQKKGNWSQFQDWSSFDDEAITSLKEIDRDNYILVRPDVIANMTNQEIADKHGKTKRWAETHASRVRAAFKKREKASPTD